MSTIRIPPIPPALPEVSEFFVLHEPFAALFDALADGSNHLAGCRFLRSIPVVFSPFVPLRGANAVDSSEVHSVPFTSSSAARFLFVAVGYSAVNSGGYVKVSLREQHATIPGNGALVDPGCYWRRSSNDLVNPVRNRIYQPKGLQWAHTGLSRPASVDSGDPASEQPRMLVLEPHTAYDLKLEWDDVKLNAILTCEAWQSEVEV